MIDFTNEEKAILAQFLASLPPTQLVNLAIGVLPILIQSQDTSLNLLEEYLSQNSQLIQSNIDNLDTQKQDQQTRLEASKSVIDGLLIKFQGS